MTPNPVGIAFLVGWPSPSLEEGHWEEVRGRPVFRLDVPIQGLSRTKILLEAFLHKHGEALRQLAPEAVCMASARGEMEALLALYEHWQLGERLPPTTSPETTAGTLATVVAHAVGVKGPAYTVSQTCISGLAALYHATLMLRSGEATRVLFGAVEAPLHPFFVEALASLRIYSSRKAFPFCLPGSGENTLALGEGLAIGVLVQGEAPIQVVHVALQTAAPAELPSYTAVSVQALRRLLERLGEGPPDFVLLHAPGTRQGDQAEWEAVKAFWGEVPALSIKLWTGHSLGAASLLSIAWAAEFLQKAMWPQVPYRPFWGNTPPKAWNEAVVLALGFGGVMGGVRLRKTSSSCS